MIASGRGSGMGGTILTPMGFNPHRQTRKDPADIALVVAALLVCAALLAWALLG